MLKETLDRNVLSFQQYFGKDPQKEPALFLQYVQLQYAHGQYELLRDALNKILIRQDEIIKSLQKK